MIAQVVVRLIEHCRRVLPLLFLLVALSLSSQETEDPAPEENLLRIPDLVITGADEVIIVPPLPILKGGGIPVPTIKLALLPWQLSLDPLPMSLTWSVMSNWLPLSLEELGIHLPETVSDGNSDQDGGDDS